MVAMMTGGATVLSGTSGVVVAVGSGNVVANWNALHTASPLQLVVKSVGNGGRPDAVVGPLIPIRPPGTPLTNPVALEDKIVPVLAPTRLPRILFAPLATF